MIRKVITIPNAMDKWIKTQIKSGYYRNDSEYFRDLIRLKKAGGRRQEAAMYPHKSI
jgi:putative addiction module CopG family antidote